MDRREGEAVSTGCSREPTFRQLKKQHAEMVERLNRLDTFARMAGGILENMLVSYSLTPEKDELSRMVDEYHRLFPADHSLEF